MSNKNWYGALKIGASGGIVSIEPFKYGRLNLKVLDFWENNFRDAGLTVEQVEEVIEYLQEQLKNYKNESNNN